MALSYTYNQKYRSRVELFEQKRWRSNGINNALWEIYAHSGNQHGLVSVVAFSDCFP